MSDPPKVFGIDRQELAAPDRAVAAIAGTVPGHAQDRPLQPVVHHAGQDVREVMRHARDRQARGRWRGWWCGSRDACRRPRPAGTMPCSAGNSVGHRARTLAGTRPRPDRRYAGRGTTVRQNLSPPRSFAAHPEREPGWSPPHRRSASGRSRGHRRRTTGCPAMTRTTESSTGRRIGRSCTRKQSAIPAKPIECLGFVCDDRLVAEIAAGRDDRAASSRSNK